MAETYGDPTAHRVEIHFETDERGGPVFHYNPEHIFVSPGDRVEWTSHEGPWSLRPSPISPFRAPDERDDGAGCLFFQGEAGEWDGGVIRDDVPLGKYANISAVYADGRVWIDDPHIIIRPRKTI